MKWNTVVLVGVLVAATVVGTVALNGHNTQAADPPKPAAQVGRYQLVVDKEGRNLLCDTATGRVYRGYPIPGDGWTEHFAAVKPE